MKRLSLVSALFVGWLAGVAPAAAGEMPVSTFGGRFNIPITSLKERAFKTITPQQYDFSCGSAALASLLTYHYDAPITETQAFQAMYMVGDQEKIHKHGFSLLDMKKFLNTLGISADGFRVSLDQIAEARIPAITLIDLRGYKHFVIIKGIRDGEVLIGDPAIGVNIMPREAFEKIWNGVAFIIREEVEIARASFNREEDWNVRGKAPLKAGLTRQGLASFTMNLRGLNEF